MEPEKSIVVAFCILLVSCNQSNNLLLGRVETRVGEHRVVVTDCYRTSVPPSQILGAEDFRFMPCRDADIRIQDGLLTVNGERYGHLNRTDSVLVDHGVVSINRLRIKHPRNYPRLGVLYVPLSHKGPL